MLVESGDGAVEHHQIRLPVAGEVHEPGRPDPGRRPVGPGGDQLERREVDGPVRQRAEIPLVVPGVRALGEQAGNAFTVQVDPLETATLDPGGEVLQVGGADLLHRPAHDRSGVVEFQRRQAPAAVPRAVPAVSGPGDGVQQRAPGCRWPGRVTGRGAVRKGVLQIGGVDQAVVPGDAGEPVGEVGGLVGDVVEHQHPSAQPGGAHLEARPVGGEGVGPVVPDARVVRCGVVDVVLAIVQHDLEHPAGVGGLRRRQVGEKSRPPAFGVE